MVNGVDIFGASLLANLATVGFMYSLWKVERAERDGQKAPLRHLLFMLAIIAAALYLSDARPPFFWPYS